MTNEPPTGLPTGRAKYLIAIGIISLLGAGAYVLQIVAGDSLSPRWHWIFTAGGGGLFFIATAWSLLAARSEAIARQALQTVAREERSSLSAVYDILRNILDVFTRMATATSDESRQAKKEQIKQLIIDTTVAIRPDARASFYVYHDGLPRKLRLDGMWRLGVGREREPREEFIDGDQGAGEYKFAAIDKRAPLFVKDAAHEHSPGWTPELGYKTYISVPVATSENIYGLLCVDAPMPGDLTANDLKTMVLLAQALTVALAI